jgi:hypothetical protein
VGEQGARAGAHGHMVCDGTGLARYKVWSEFAQFVHAWSLALAVHHLSDINVLRVTGRSCCSCVRVGLALAGGAWQGCAGLPDSAGTTGGEM